MAMRITHTHRALI